MERASVKRSKSDWCHMFGTSGSPSRPPFALFSRQATYKRWNGLIRAIKDQSESTTDFSSCEKHKNIGN